MAQEPAPASKTPVFLRCKCENDTIAESVATSLRDEFSTSPRYRLSAETEARFVIGIVSGQIASPEPVSAMSLVFVRTDGHRLVGHELILCSAGKIKWCAQMALADFDDSISK